MNAHCPSCGYPLHRDNHPVVGVVKFCRAICVRRWTLAHVAASATFMQDVLPEGVADRRAS